ncbi:M23 family metallopeptidase [Segetibacter sp. 3557_3]|uniref:M23 family metallopeptidase n=1 Tax=Segetibacter sp. 3557_3 TaxID=2547429 RepID=UPI001058671D|nr:M23 family metallopeptidase [Segetibacter sp. 3557_3]TDH24097.1 M23 family metallopeptidase [Segetibacter sp. 3557_3]
MTKINRPALFVLLMLSFSPLCAQTFPDHNYPVNYFRNPMNIPIQLSGNFGELRTNHFHMGLDIRTNQRENLPVYAAAEGYISRVKIERYGYGRAIYIKHPNGYTTLYAHLNDFYPDLNRYVKEVQYNTEQWEQYIEFPAGKFPISKGQFIANSGNTGGSQGPHLHFEIRETSTDKNVNPLHFNLNIPDHVRPTIYGLYYYDRRFSTYQATPNRIRLKAAGNSFTSIDTVVRVSTPIISLGLSAEDKTDRSFKFGIYQAELSMDDTLRNAFRMDDFSYDDSRYINANIDYRTKYRGGAYIQHLSILPGSKSPIYLEGATGVLRIDDGEVHSISLVVKDVSGNTTTINFRVRYVASAIQNQAANPAAEAMFPGQENKLEKPGIEVRFSKTAFYDTVPFIYATQQPASGAIVSAVHSLHNFTVPVHDSFTVRIQPTADLPEQLRDRVVMQLVNERKKVAVKGSWKNNQLEAKYWDLGKVQLILDTVPPVVRPVGWRDGSLLSKATSITFAAADDAGELKSFRAELDGKWLMFSRKSDYFIHRFDERTSAGSHELLITATDEAGNITSRMYRFTR